MSKHSLKEPSIRDLYPRLNDEELKEAEETLDAYLELVWRIFSRLKEEGRLDEISRLVESSKKDNHLRS